MMEVLRQWWREEHEAVLRGLGIVPADRPHDLDDRKRVALRGCAGGPPLPVLFCTDSYPDFCLSETLIKIEGYHADFYRVSTTGFGENC
jgi:hypothetical protein